MPPTQSSLTQSMASYTELHLPHCPSALDPPFCKRCTDWPQARGIGNLRTEEWLQPLAFEALFYNLGETALDRETLCLDLASQVFTFRCSDTGLSVQPSTVLPRMFLPTYLAFLSFSKAWAAMTPPFASEQTGC